MPVWKAYLCYSFSAQLELQFTSVTGGSVWSIQQHMPSTIILLYNVTWSYVAFATVPRVSWFSQQVSLLVLLFLYTDCTKNSHKSPLFHTQFGASLSDSHSGAVIAELQQRRLWHELLPINFHPTVNVSCWLSNEVCVNKLISILHENWLECSK